MALDCEPVSVDTGGALGSAACDPADEVIDQLTLQAFADTDVLRSTWQDATEEDSVEQVDDACANATPGARKWGFGNIACEVKDGRARIRWTDSRIGLLGSVEGTSDDIDELYAWWQSNARKIGRTADSGGDTPAKDPAPREEESRPPRTGKLVRVPGRPRSITCEAISDVIPDEWDRAWRLTTIDFENKKGYERVILNLKRTGKNNTRWPTEAVIERMKNPQVRKAVPNAPRPRRGSVAMVVRLDGVRDAPNLFRYRPSGLDLVKEVSVAKDGSGRAVVISAPPQTCYQMRIPVWGANASGKEKKAEIFIDLKQR
jgi:hypothetical protein